MAACSAGSLFILVFFRNCNVCCSMKCGDQSPIFTFTLYHHCHPGDPDTVWLSTACNWDLGKECKLKTC